MPDPRDPSNPLSADDIARLRRDRAVLNQAYLDIEKAKACGLHCAGEQACCDALAQRIDAILAHYGGDKKSR